MGRHVYSARALPVGRRKCVQVLTRTPLHVRVSHSLGTAPTVARVPLAVSTVLVVEHALPAVATYCPQTQAVHRQDHGYQLL